MSRANSKASVSALTPGLAAVGAALAGPSVATSVASWAGITTIPLLTKGAAAVGMTLVGATPLGWTALATLGLGAAAFASARSLQRRGAGLLSERQAQAQHEAQLRQRRQQQWLTEQTPELRAELALLVQQAVATRAITAAEAERIDRCLAEGWMAPTEAKLLLGEVIAEAANG